MIWHKGVAVNVWRGVISQEIDQSCSVCLRGIRETVMHGFWECSAAQRAWRWCEAIINHMAPLGEIRERQTAAPSNRTDRDALTRYAASIRGSHPRHNSVTGNAQGLRRQKLTINWKLGIFGHRLPNRFKLVSRVWLLTRGVVLWHIWAQRNEAAFGGHHWHPTKLYHKLWLSMIDYDRLSWSRVQGKVEKATNNQEKRKKLIKNFQSSWCRKSLFALWVTDHP